MDENQNPQTDEGVTPAEGQDETEETSSDETAAPAPEGNQDAA